MTKIAFICTANMCRSPMAQAIFEHEAAARELSLHAVSAGTMGIQGYLPVDEAVATCRNHGVTMPPIRSDSVHNIVPELQECARIFVMENAHAEYLLRNVHLQPDRITLLGQYRTDSVTDEEIPDPIGQDLPAFDQCFELLRDCIRGYLNATEELDGER